MEERTTLSACVWIKPDGTIIETSHAEHWLAAEPYFPEDTDAELAASAAGWVRVSVSTINPGYRRRPGQLSEPIQPTKLQMRALEKWCEAVDEEKWRVIRRRKVNDFEDCFVK